MLQIFVSTVLFVFHYFTVYFVAVRQMNSLYYLILGIAQLPVVAFNCGLYDQVNVKGVLHAKWSAKGNFSQHQLDVNADD